MSNPGEETVREYREIKGTRKNKHRDHRSFSIPDEQLGPITDAQEGCEKNDLKEKIGPKPGISEAGVNVEVNSKADGSRRKKSEKKSREKNRNDHDGELGRSQQREAKLYDSTKKLAREQAKTSKRSLTNKVSVVHEVEVDYCAQHSYSLPCKADGCSAKSNIALADADPNRNSDKISQCVPLSAKASNTSSRDPTSHKPVSDKGRSISPLQRLSFIMGKASKTNSERVAGSTTHLESMASSIKTG
ncbi:unnamed protein product, partial [Brassica rapa]